MKSLNIEEIESQEKYRLIGKEKVEFIKPFLGDIDGGKPEYDKIKFYSKIEDFKEEVRHQ